LQGARSAYKCPPGAVGSERRSWRRGADTGTVSAQSEVFDPRIDLLGDRKTELEQDAVGDW